MLALLSTPAWSQENVPSAADDSQDQAESSARKGLLPLRTYGGPLSEREYLLGNWWDVRDRLIERGMRYELNWTQVLQGVTDGGAGDETEYGGKFEIPVLLDLDRMDVLPGALLSLRVESKYGESVNRDARVLLAPNDVQYFPQGDPGDDSVLAVTEVRYTQFLSKVFGVFLGKLTVLGGDANEFAGGRGDTQFLGHSFIAPAVTALMNPYSGLGAGVFWMSGTGLTLTSSVYSTNDAATTSGVDELSEGLTWSTSLRSQYESELGPGGMNFVFQSAFDGDFADVEGQFVEKGILNLPSESDSWNAFWNVWQYLSVQEESGQPVDPTNGRTDLRGTGVFARFGVADHETNPVKWALSVGVGGRGAFSDRKDDTFGVGYARSELRESLLTDSALVDDSGHRWEAYYSFALTPAVSLTLNAQLLDPLLETVDTVSVLGMRLRCSL